MWVIYGGTDNSFYLLEYPLLILIGLIFYFPVHINLKNNILAALTSALPLITVYVVIDVFYFYSHRLLRVSDIKNVLNLWDIYPLLFVGLIFVVIMSFISMIFVLFIIGSGKINVSVKRLFVGSAFRLLLITALVTLFSTNTLYSYQGKFLNYNAWSDVRDIKKNGRLTSIIYYSKKNNDAAKKLAIHQQKGLQNPLSVEILRKRNIHIVMLESFIDPRYIKDVTFNKPPLYEKMRDILNNDHLDIAVSPVYGGGTDLPPI